MRPISSFGSIYPTYLVNILSSFVVGFILRWNQSHNSIKKTTSPPQKKRREPAQRNNSLLLRVVTIDAHWPFPSSQQYKSESELFIFEHLKILSPFFFFYYYFLAGQTSVAVQRTLSRWESFCTIFSYHIYSTISWNYNIRI
jgi:hypothetical protein